MHQVLRVDKQDKRGRAGALLRRVIDFEPSSAGGRGLHGKLRVGKHLGRRPAWKKAYVTLAEGNRIDFFEGA